jgi:hypothetical protein
MRDAVLAVSDRLDPTVGGRPVDIIAEPSSNRRTLYAFIDRQNLPGVFRMFDFASPDATSAQRFVTTVPQQALFMMNSPFLIAQSKAAAAHTAPAHAPATADDVRRLYRKVLARDAENTEVDAALQFLSEQESVPAEAAKPVSETLTPWEKLSQVLIATNEFVFVD